MKNLTIDEALNMVPTYSFLNPGDPIVAGDEYRSDYTGEFEMENRGRSRAIGEALYVDDANEERMVVQPEVLWRRPIPEAVRHDIAKTIMFLSTVKTEASIGSPDLAYARWLLATGRAV